MKTYLDRESLRQWRLGNLNRLSESLSYFSLLIWTVWFHQIFQESAQNKQKQTSGKNSSRPAEYVSYRYMRPLKSDKFMSQITLKFEKLSNVSNL